MSINLPTNLSQIGLKQTPGRNEILRFFMNKNAPVDVSEINEHLQNQDIDINQTTIYRILDLFYSKGIIDKLEFQEGKFRYELKGEEHHHLICENCGKIDDMSDCSLAKLESEIFKKKGFKVKRHSLEFFGLCKKCNL